MRDLNLITDAVSEYCNNLKKESNIYHNSLNVGNLFDISLTRL